MSPSVLHLVPTPIGNLKDVTLRAIEVLFSVDLIVCEDTRRTGLLLLSLKPYLKLVFKENEPLNHPPLLSCNDFNETQRLPQIIDFLQNGKSAALVSDAGTPLISDPGFKLVREAIKNNIKVESLPGPSSVITALPLSGFPLNEFLFLGYPPNKGSKRSNFFEQLKRFVANDKLTTIIFESPHRLLKTLSELQETLGEKQLLMIARELTKLHEEVRRETIEDATKHYSINKPRGEFTIVISGEVAPVPLC